MQEKVSIMGVWSGQKKSVTRDHCSASLGKPRDADHVTDFSIHTIHP